MISRVVKHQDFMRLNVVQVVFDELQNVFAPELAHDNLRRFEPSDRYRCQQGNMLLLVRWDVDVRRLPSRCPPELLCSVLVESSLVQKNLVLDRDLGDHFAVLLPV